jgi:hypothetical protein
MARRSWDGGFRRRSHRLAPVCPVSAEGKSERGDRGDTSPGGDRAAVSIAASPQDLAARSGMSIRSGCGRPPEFRERPSIGRLAILRRARGAGAGGRRSDSS